MEWWALEGRISRKIIEDEEENEDDVVIL